MFVFEGAAYDVVAAVIGAALGAVVAYGMVIVIASAFGAEDSDAGLQVEYAVAWRSLVVAFAIGVLLTLVVVAVSAWRVSVMTISTAIRNLPEPPSSKKSRRWILAVLGLALGAFIAMSGAAADAATALMLGISLVVISLVPILRLLGASERIAYTACGLALVVLMLMPWEIWEAVFGQISMDFSTWIVSGLMTVIGAVWVMVFNADLLLRGASLVGRAPSLAPVVRLAMTYPLKARFRTGRPSRCSRSSSSRSLPALRHRVPSPQPSTTSRSSAEASRSAQAPRQARRSPTCAPPCKLPLGSARPTSRWSGASPCCQSRLDS